MSTNPYSSPLAYSEPATTASQQTRSVVRVFKMLGWLACIVGLVMLVTLFDLIRNVFVRDDLLGSLGVICIYSISLPCGVLYIRTASRLARGDPRIYTRARWLSGLIMAGFPLFPFGLMCFPVLVPVGIMCLHTVKRYYVAHCEGLSAAEFE